MIKRKYKIGETVIIIATGKRAVIKGTMLLQGLQLRVQIEGNNFDGPISLKDVRKMTKLDKALK